MKKLCLSLGLLGLINGSHNLSAEESIPDSMAAMGDSITASAFAAFPRQEAKNAFLQMGLVLKGLAAMVGRQFNKDRFIGIEARQLSWATGLDDKLRVISHARRLQYLNPKMKIYNIAISGGTSETVSDYELKKLETWSLKKLNKSYPDYVTLLIGPNDICANEAKGESMTEESVFYDRISRVADDILAKNENSRILISAIPNITTLRDVAKNSSVFRTKKYDTCEKIWRLFSFCPNLQLKDNREEEAKRVTAFNNILKNIAFEKNQEFHGDRVRVAESIYRFDFTENDLALDCFHPNHHAQNKIADLTFEESWWSSQWKSVREKALKNFEAAQKKMAAKTKKQNLKVMHSTAE